MYYYLTSKLIKVYTTSYVQLRKIWLLDTNKLLIIFCMYKIYNLGIKVFVVNDAII